MSITLEELQSNKLLLNSLVLSTCSAALNSQVEELKNKLELQDIIKLNDEEFDEYLTILLNLAAENNSYDSFMVIYHKFEESIMKYDKQSRDNTNFLPTRIFCLLQISDNSIVLLKRYLDSTAESNYFDLMVTMLNSEINNSELTVIDKIEKCYGKQELIVYQNLLDYSNQHCNQGYCPINTKCNEMRNVNSYVRRHIIDMIKLNNKYKKPPKYLLLDNLTESERIMKADSIQYDIINKPIVPLLGMDMVNLILSFPERENLLEKYKNSNLLEKNSIMIELIKSDRVRKMQDNVELLKLLGPSNIRVDCELLDNHKCSKYGGCRMFLCTEYEDENYWFTGSCDFCLLKIRKKEYAVRQPLALGGWRGCYCSFNCVILDLTNYDGTGPIVVNLSKYYNKQIKNNGIYS